MRPPISVRDLTDQERDRLEAGLHAREVYELRRCQILLASARGERAPRIAEVVGCTDQAVRNVIREFERAGLEACLTRGSSRPHTIHAKVDAVAAKQLRALLHRSPRTFGKPTSVWTMELAAEVSATNILIRGFEPLKDTPRYGRELIPRVRELVARRAEAAVPA